MSKRSCNQVTPNWSSFEPGAGAKSGAHLRGTYQEAPAPYWPAPPVGEHALARWPGAMKRAMDVSVAAMLIILAAPVLLLISILIKLDSKGPILFLQPRVGHGNRIFTIVKFRTMHVAYADLGAHRQTNRGDDRVTRIGALLRRFSLDELPQIFNVLGGSMSLVGPRPHAVCTTANGVPLEQAVPAYSLRHRVKPGITGLAQVNGSRGELNSVEKLIRRVEFDLKYVDEWSFGLDLRILWKTALIVLRDPHAY